MAVLLAVGATVPGLARLEPLAMARASSATAFAQFLMAVIALLIWRPDFRPGIVDVFGLNFFFVLLFAGSALLFRPAAQNGDKVDS